MKNVEAYLTDNHLSFIYNGNKIEITAILTDSQTAEIKELVRINSLKINLIISE